jgi:hypothetical protein
MPKWRRTRTHLICQAGGSCAHRQRHDFRRFDVFVECDLSGISKSNKSANREADLQAVRHSATLERIVRSMRL